MRKFAFILTIGCLFIFCLFSSAIAIPDPRDSVIIESKTITPGVGSPAAVVGVYITNKDTLANVTLSLVERSISGGAYMALAWPRNFDGVVTSLNTRLQNGVAKILNGLHYNSTPPDTFIVAMVYHPLDVPGTAEPPNLVRKRILEIKFDSVWSNCGIVELDSALFRPTASHWIFTSFVGLAPADVMVNFVKGTITVCDEVVSAVDVGAILRKVFLEYALPQCPS